MTEHLTLYNLISYVVPYNLWKLWKTYIEICTYEILVYWLFSSVQSLSHVSLFATLWTTTHQASLYIPTSRGYTNSCPSHWWCHPNISPSFVPFSSRLQSCPALGSFPMIQFFTLGGQSIGVSASTSVIPMNIQDWFPLGLTGLISLQSKGLSRGFSNTTVQKHQFFSAQLSSPSNSHIHTWLLGKT